MVSTSRALASVSTGDRSTQGAMANIDHVVGALVVTVAIIATAEVARALRFIIIALGV